MTPLQYFDPSAPIALVKWGDVRSIDARESKRLRDEGAFWLPLAFDPFDKVLAGSKRVEVRNVKPFVARLRVGTPAVLSRGYRLPHLAAVVVDRREYPDLAHARADAAGAALLREAGL